MNFVEWLTSTFSSAVFLVGLGWLCRQLIATRLKASVQHEFDGKLETIRADFRKSEELFKADLRTKENQIAALQGGALSGMVSRQVALDKRRLEAIDQLWAGLEALAPFKVAAFWMRTINFENALKSASEDQQVREFFLKIGQTLDPKNLPKIDVHRARPFVSEMAWALFAAYQAIVGYAMAQLQMLKVGLNEAQVLDSSAVSKLVIAVMPHYSEYLEKHGAKAYPYIVEPLEAALLKELQHMLNGEESDKKSVEQAARIMQAVKSINEAMLKDAIS